MSFLKIVMVGGGSYNWLPTLLGDLVQTPELRNSEIWLLDPLTDAANELKAAIEKADGNSPDYRFIVTDSEEEAFRDADFVVITISTGGLEAMRKDIAIPEKYGIFQTVGDSAGPGGWARTIRNYKVFRDMVEKIEKLSPHAMILNYTNPMAGLTGVISRHCSLRHVGLCHGLFSVYWAMQRIFGCQEKDIRVNFAGVNHFFWVTGMKICGGDGLAMLREKLQGRSMDELITGGSDVVPDHKGEKHLLAAELFEKYGALTYFEDRHTSEYLPGILNDPEEMARLQLIRTTIERRYEKVRKNRAYTLKMISGEKGLFKRSRETAVDIIRAAACGTTFADVMNLENIGQISNLPMGAVVETMGCIRDGVPEPIAFGALPDGLAALTAPHCTVQKLTVDALVTGNRKMLSEALFHDPVCSFLPPDKIMAMTNELLEANKPFLPEM